MASFNHFKNLNYMSEFAKAKGMPSPKLAVGGTGVILLVGGLGDGRRYTTRWGPLAHLLWMDSYKLDLARLCADARHNTPAVLRPA